MRCLLTSQSLSSKPGAMGAGSYGGGASFLAPPMNRSLGSVQPDAAPMKHGALQLCPGAQICHTSALAAQAAAMHASRVVAVGMPSRLKHQVVDMLTGKLAAPQVGSTGEGLPNKCRHPKSKGMDSRTSLLLWAIAADSKSAAPAAARRILCVSNGDLGIKGRFTKSAGSAHKARPLYTTNVAVD